MTIRFSPDVIKSLRKIKRTDTKLLFKIQKQLSLFSKNPKHSSLRLHKLSGKLQNRWSISITRTIRIVYILLNTDTAYFIAIGTHDEVYRR